MKRTQLPFIRLPELPQIVETAQKAPVQEYWVLTGMAQCKQRHSCFVLVCFSETTTPGSAGESKKSFNVRHRAKREESNNFAIVKKLILDKQRPFTGCGASDASGGFFSAS